ncbi:MAG TPA: glycosyltransferase family 39 protein [Verrucomicrobiae bacterium]|nr:glycosyltransferase family 39 protein [Verrucomicrobiae bacterium]
MNTAQCDKTSLTETQFERTPAPSNAARTLAMVPGEVWVLLLTLACLLGFIHKAVHIDDTLFLRAAAHIQHHPGNFYGFNMNWYGSDQPMIEQFDNPPFTSYYLAFVAWVGGWSEGVLHLSFILPALAAAWGIYRLGRYYSARPLLAASAAVLTPVFLISATTLMSDVLLLAFWVWAMVCFESGLRGARMAWLAGGLLAGLAFITKFSGLSLVPLFLAYGFWRQRRLGNWLIAPLLPLLFAAGYEWLTFRLYGKGLLLTASGVASGASHWHFLDRAFTGLSFAGGCFLPVLFYVPWLWSARSFIKGFCVIAPSLLLYPYQGSFALLWNPDGSPDWLLCIESFLFIAAGLHIFLLAANDLWDHRDATSLLLCLWVFGVFLFATFVNWSLNGRSFLPMAPPIGILLSRRMDWQCARNGLSGNTFVGKQFPVLLGRKGPGRGGPLSRNFRVALLAPALAAAVVSFFPAKADYNQAAVGRTATQEICARYQQPGKSLWFEGHWGFQYYMEKQGAKALDHYSSKPAPGEFIAVPSEAVNLFDLSTNLIRLVETFEYRPNRFWSTMSSTAGAGFYTAKAGPVPFVADSTEPERYYVFRVIQPSPSAGNPTNNQAGPGALMQQFWCERSIRIWKKALRKNPGLIKAQLELGGIAEFQCQPAQAIGYYQAALRQAPDSARALNRLAWLRATSPDPTLRNGREAVQLATRADELTGHKSPEALTTLAAAFAEEGHFDEALAAGQKAIDLARASKQPNVLALNEQMLALYRAGHPFRQ